jgi:uncharacterized membrane protein
MIPRPVCGFASALPLFLLGALPALGQAPAKPSAQVPGTAGTQKKPASPPAPQSKHYPILLIASGTEPFWNLRIGMKGAERLERVSYPPITLEPGEIVADESGTAWNYRAKDTATGADVTVRLSRESCSDGMSENKYSFRAVVTHAQIGELKGCARIAPDQFPEFKQKNLDEDDPEKKKVVMPPITNFKPPVAVAYLDPAGRVIVSRGEATKVAAPKGYQLSLSHDGKRLLYTREETGKDRTILLYDAVTGKTSELIRGLVQSAFWSPDDLQVAFLKFVDPAWTVWTVPANSPDQAQQLSASGVWALHGWSDMHTVLASDNAKLYFLRTESPPTSIPIREIYGDEFEVTSTDTIRANPVNPDLLLVTANVTHPKAGMLTDPRTGFGGAAFVYEIKSKRQAILTPPNALAQDAEWSRDGLQIFFTNREKAPVICRVFWDGSGYKRQRGGTFLVVGQ